MDKPILFSALMVRAILEGRKTQTRRVVKFKKLIENPIVGFSAFTSDGEFSVRGIHQNGEYGESIFKLPYDAGDTLWVRETFARIGCIGWDIDKFEYAYRADFGHTGGKWEGYADMCFDKWKPSIFMPRAAARIHLLVTSVRVERLQDISREDAINEGIEQVQSAILPQAWGNYNLKGDDAPYFANPISSFKTLWEAINGFGSWDSNPWVWVIEFEKI